MIQLRWYVEGDKRTLQYRQQYDATIFAGLNRPVNHTPNMQWSDWTEVPVEVAPTVGPISAESVAHLRDISDCPMMECKKALTACNGDMNLAVEWLRSRRNFRTWL